MSLTDSWSQELEVPEKGMGKREGTFIRQSLVLGALTIMERMGDSSFWNQSGESSKRLGGQTWGGRGAGEKDFRSPESPIGRSGSSPALSPHPSH